MLNMPSDAQRLVNGNFLITDTGNHRVIEIEDQRLVWQYGNPENLASGGYGNDPGFLSYPQAALRMDNGHTLIVDAGNLRLIEVNGEGEIVFEHKTNEGPEEHQMDSPFRSAYMPNGLIMLLSESSVIEIDPKAKEVVWACQLSEFERAKVTLKPQQTTKRFMKHGLENPYLRFKQDDVDPSEDAQNRIQELVAQRMAASRTANSNKAHISRFGEADLLPLDFFLVERNKNRVVRADRDGNLSWRYGEKDGEDLQKPHACTRTPDGHLLLSDTDRHRIIEIDPATSAIVWQFGETDSPRTGDKGLNRPRFAQVMPNGHFLISDQNNRRVFEMRRNKQIAWVYEGLDKLMAPYHAERLENGNTLITDWGAHIVVEVSPEGQVVWSFGERKVAGADASHLSYPEHAARLANGNTLISDTRNDRVLEINSEGQLLWELDGKDAIKFGSPTYARRMKNGHTLVIHSSNRQMLEVDAKRKLVWKLMLPFDRPTSPAKADASADKA
jgi:outer membrane protein assembly factor BamB